MTVIEKIKTVDKKNEQNKAPLKFQFHHQKKLEKISKY